MPIRLTGESMNLIPFALYSTKIPGSFLLPRKKKQNHIRNLFSLCCDYSFTMFLTLMISEFFKMYAAIYLMTVSTKFTISFPATMIFVTYPLVTFTYFSICLLANDGMTVGTYFTKQRLFTKKEYQQAFMLTLNALTLNFMYPKMNKYFRSQDYRYQKLIEENFETINLHDLIKEAPEYQEEEEDFQIAA